MTPAERQLAAEKFNTRSHPVHLSRWLRELREEVASGRPGSVYTMKMDPSGNGDILARALGKLGWDTSEQEWLLLDGTPSPALRCVFPDLREVRIDVRRNADIVQVTTNTYSKNTTLAEGKPTELLEQASRFIEVLDAIDPGGVAVFTTKAIRRALTGEPEGRLAVHTPFRGSLLGHYGNQRGNNDFEERRIAALIGRQERAVEIVEDEARALYNTTPDPIKFVEPDDKERKFLPKCETAYLMRDGCEIATYASYHPDPRVQQQNEATRENEMIQALDRLRSVHNVEANKICILSSVPLPVELASLCTATDIARMGEFREFLRARASSGIAGAEVVPLTGEALVALDPKRWKTRNRAETG